MPEKPRYLTSIIKSDALDRGKMAFISGPRQVGKSTLAQSLLQSENNYFLYDDETFRRSWARSPQDAIINRGAGPIVLDEIHKDRKWKTRLKGLYDLHRKKFGVIVTGSARLDYYRKGEDSLMGRYLPYHLHPFSVAEDITPVGPDDIFSKVKINYDWDDLIRLSGFPEPLLSGNEQQAARWSRLRRERLVYEDSRDFLNISDVNAFRTLTDLLPERAGSLLSINSLHEDAGKAYATVRSWVHVLEALFFVFRIKPYSKKLARALKAETKVYMYDLLRIPAAQHARRLENLTALHLLKACDFWSDSAQGEFELRFIRDKQKREVDFLLLRDSLPWMLVECKSNEKNPSHNLKYFSEYLKPAYSIQLVTDSAYDRFFAGHNIRVMGYTKFFSNLL